MSDYIFIVRRGDMEAIVFYAFAVSCDGKLN